MPGPPYRSAVVPLAVMVGLGACKKKELDGAAGSPPSATEPDHARNANAPTPGAPSAPTTDTGDAPTAQKMRERLVRQIETLDSPWGGDEAWDAKVLDVMRRTPRHRFMPGASLANAYQDTPYPIGHGQTISQPTIVALMTQALRLSGSEKVLEIGTGSGYQAAVLSPLVKELFTIEIVEPLGEVARERLTRLGYDNVTVRIGDGYRGWPEEARFDRIILTAAPPKMPPALVDQLKEGGIIVAPVGETDQWLYRWTKRGGKLQEERLGAVRFVPMVPQDEGVEEQR